MMKPFVSRLFLITLVFFLFAPYAHTSSLLLDTRTLPNSSVSYPYVITPSDATDEMNIRILGLAQQLRTMEQKFRVSEKDAQALDSPEDGLPWTPWNWSVAYSLSETDSTLSILFKVNADRGRLGTSVTLYSLNFNKTTGALLNIKDYIPAKRQAYVNKLVLKSIKEQLSDYPSVQSLQSWPVLRESQPWTINNLGNVVIWITTDTLEIPTEGIVTVTVAKRYLQN
ncbi:MAG: hypothetical protein ACRC5C_09480 [Bacilli bacterium]